MFSDHNPQHGNINKKIKCERQKTFEKSNILGFFPFIFVQFFSYALDFVPILRSDHLIIQTWHVQVISLFNECNISTCTAHLFE